jgi:hypothetical protein
VLRALVQGLAQRSGSNPVDAYRLLSDKEALKRSVRNCPAGPLHDFLEHHLPRLDYAFTISSLDEIGKIATNPILRVALCQRDRAVPFDRLLRHRLLLLNLSKPALGGDGANFLGAIYLAQLWAALQRVGRTDHPVYLFLDEVHNYAIPTLADMLSEGAKFGLHVLAVTQYLHRVPPRIRAALVGNVDAWFAFSLGAEDSEDVWKIVNGSGHGWTPQDLIDGLRPHEVAMAVPRALLKVGTLPVPAPSTGSARLREIVTESSRRYARTEDSQESFLDVTREETLAFLEAFTDENGRTPAGLASQLGWPPSRIRRSIRLGLESGDVLEGQGSEGVIYGLRARGFFHREALRGARNESDEHSDLLAEVGAYLRTRGIHPSVICQGGGYLRADGEFDRLGRTYNVEVECGTLAKHPKQTLANVRKAIADGRRCLVLVSDRRTAERAAAVLSTNGDDALHWREVGVVWRSGKEELRPYEVDGRRTWGFLPGGADEDPAGPSGVSIERVVRAPSERSDIGIVREAVRKLLASGRIRVTASDFADVLRPVDGHPIDQRRLGMALRSLGVAQLRTMENGVLVRTYDLGPLSDFRRISDL